jgi:hypothetical protein
LSLAPGGSFATLRWPISIKTTVGLILRSPVPIVTRWGEAGTMIYDDAYSHSLSMTLLRVLVSENADAFGAPFAPPAWSAAHPQESFR